MSRRPQDVAAARAFLIAQRHRPDDRMPRYGEVAAVYGGIAQGVAPVLNSIADACATDGEPDLSALVVRGSTGLPGVLNGQPVDDPTPAIRAAWSKVLADIRNYPWPAG